MLTITIKHELSLATLVNGLMVLLLAVGGSEPPLVLAGLRLVVGLVFLLFMPGFLLQSVLFGSSRELNAVERIALSMGLSGALVAALALLLDVLPWGLRLEAMVISVILLTTLLALAGGLRRRATRPEGLLVIPLDVRSWWIEQDGVNRLLYGVMALAFLGVFFFRWRSPPCHVPVMC